MRKLGLRELPLQCRCLNRRQQDLQRRARQRRRRPTHQARKRRVGDANHTRAMNKAERAIELRDNAKNRASTEIQRGFKLA